MKRHFEETLKKPEDLESPVFTEEGLTQEEIITILSFNTYDEERFVKIIQWIDLQPTDESKLSALIFSARTTGCDDLKKQISRHFREEFRRLKNSVGLAPSDKEIVRRKSVFSLRKIEKQIDEDYIHSILNEPYLDSLEKDVDTIFSWLKSRVTYQEREYALYLIITCKNKALYKKISAILEAEAAKLLSGDHPYTENSFNIILGWIYTKNIRKNFTILQSMLCLKGSLKQELMEWLSDKTKRFEEILQKTDIEYKALFQKNMIEILDRARAKGEHQKLAEYQKTAESGKLNSEGSNALMDLIIEKTLTPDAHDLIDFLEMNPGIEKALMEQIVISTQSTMLLMRLKDALQKLIRAANEHRLINELNNRTSSNRPASSNVWSSGQTYFSQTIPSKIFLEQAEYNDISPVYSDHEISKVIRANIEASDFNYFENHHYLLQGDQEGGMFHCSEKNQPYWVASVPPVDSSMDRISYFQGSDNSSISVSSLSLRHCFDKKTITAKDHLADLLESLLDELEKSTFTNKQEIVDYLDRIHALTGTRWESVREILDEHEDDALDEIKIALALKWSSIPQPTDVMEELMPKMLSAVETQAKILIPYNVSTEYHWKTCEIQIIKSDTHYDVHVYMHDPYGGGRPSEVDMKEIESIIGERITSFQNDATINFFAKESTFNARQDPKDKTSCGVVCIRDFLKRIHGKSLDMDIPYPVGTREQREEDELLINSMEKCNINGGYQK